MSEIQPNLFWSSGNNSLIIGNSGSYTNPIDASVVLGASQIASSGLYPLKISLNQGNFFVLTKDGKVAINTPSFPVYESSPNFHMVGRCAVFEGTCGAGGVALTLYNNPDVVPQVGSIAGSLNLSARNNNRNVVNFAQVQSKILNPLKGQTRGQFVVNVESSGAAKPILKLDDSVNQIGINDVDNATYTSVLGSGNLLSYVNNSKIIGDGNSASRSNNLYLLGSDNSVDLIKNSVMYVLGYDAGESPLAGVPSDLNWGPNDDLSVGDIIKIENNGLYNGYYIASTGVWTKIDNNVAVAYVGTSNILIGSENELSGNNVIAIGNSSVASGNNIFMFGSYNSIKTQKLTGILSSGNQIDNSYVLGSYNSIEASGTIVFGSHNMASGISAIVLNGSRNTIASGSMDSVLIGDNNFISSISGIILGSDNTGRVTLGSAIGYGNNLLLSDSNVYGSKNNLSGVYNNVFGNNSSISGSYVSSIGQSINSVGSNNLIFGYNDNLTGSSGIFIGNSNNIAGNNLLALGSNTVVSGNRSVVLGNNNSVSDIENSSIYGYQNLLRSGEYLHANILGHDNVITSGIANIRVIGDSNTLNNIFNLEVPYTETFYNAEYSVKADKTSSNLFQIGDTVVLRDREETFVVENKIPDADANSTQFTLEFQTPIPSGLQDQTIYIKSKTLQDQIIHDYSNPVTLIGNENTFIGMSGLLVGNINYASGNNIFNIASASKIIGNNVINIGSKLISNSGDNIINIGGNFQGITDNLTSIGFNNVGEYKSNFVIGTDNKVLNGEIIGSGNLIYDRNALVIGDSNTAVGYGKPYGNTNDYLFASGTYDTSLDAIVLTQNSSRLYGPTTGRVQDAQKLIIQLALSGTYLPAFSGYATQIRGDQLFFAQTGPNYGTLLNPIVDIFNPVPLQTFIRNLFPSVVPDNIDAMVYPISDEQKLVVGNNNNVIDGKYISVFGNNNKYGSDIQLLTASASGLVLGSNNTLEREGFLDRGNFVWKYPGDSLFQGAIGFSITNNDPNSIRVGHSSNTFKIFDNGGRKDRTVSEITDPFTIPPTRENVQKEMVGQNAFRRGVLFNSNAQSDTVVGVLGSSETAEPALIVVPSSENRVGINTSLPQSTLDVSGTVSTSGLRAINATINNLAIPTNAAQGYFLTSKDNTGAVEWKSGLKIDFQGLPGTLMYWSGVNLTDGKVQPISQLVQSPKDSTTVPLNQVVYNASGCMVSKSGLIFEQYSWCDKYAIMALDGLRRQTLAETLAALEDSGDVNPHELRYADKLLEYARAERRVQESYYVPYSANVLYFVPELISLRYLSTANESSRYASVLNTAGYNREGILAIGRRNNSMPSPINDNIEETNIGGSFAAASLPNGMVAPQHIISTIPKKNTRQKKVHYRFNRNEMKFYTEMLHKSDTVIDTPLAAYLRPMESAGDLKGWWDASGAPDDAVVPQGNDTDLDRAVPTAFNMGLEEIDFVIYGTGSKYRSADTVDVPKFVVGSEADFKAWAIDPDTPIDLPCVTKVPAFYYNASINSFMLHTMKPSWIPIPIPGDECKPCNPKESGVWFADLTVRGWIGTSGIRIGTGLTRQVEVDPEDPTKVREMVDAKGTPLFRSTRGMYLRSDAYGFAVWDEGPDGVSRSSNDIIRVPSSTETTLVEGSLDPLIDIANFPVETNDILTSARLVRDTLTVKSDAEAISNSFRIRGVTRNTLLFAQNPSPNTYYRTGKTNKFNEPPYQNDNNSLNESTVDGTENVFYYGYSNALAGLLLYNNSLQKTEVWVDGDATKRVHPGDVLRLVIYYKPDNHIEGQPYPQKIIKVPVLGVNAVWLSGEKTATEKTLQTQIVLTEKLEIEPSTYSLDSTNQLRQVALMSENVGGYMTFNFPGATPELILSNREGIPNLFNTSGKRIDFAVYGSFKGNRPDPSIFVDSVNKGVNINTAKSARYGWYNKSITFDSSLLTTYKADINSPIYYDYGWQEKHLLGTIEETSSLIKITGSAQISAIDFVVGDVVEIIYDNTQKIVGQIVTRTVSTPAQPGPAPWDIRVSLTAVNPGLVDNRIGNILRVKDQNGVETAGIVNNNVKIKVIKRQLALSTVDGPNNTTQTKAEGNIPLTASLSVKGLTYSDGLMLSDKDSNGNIVLPHNSVLYNRHGMVFGSNLRFFTYDDLLIDNKKNQHLLYNTDVPAVIATGVVSSKINGNVPVFADTTLKGSTKIEQLYIDNLSSFDTIDGGQVVFGGTCNGANLQCQ